MPVLYSGIIDEPSENGMDEGYLENRRLGPLNLEVHHR